MASNPRVEGDGRMDNPLIDWREQLRKEDERAATFFGLVGLCVGIVSNVLRCK